VLFVTGRNKRAIEDHFDHDDLLSQRLAETGHNDQTRLLCEDLPLRFLYTRQGTPLGTGHAVLQGREFAGRDTFIVVLGDSIIKGGKEADLLRRMIRSHRASSDGATIAVERVPRDHLDRYGVVQPLGGLGDEFDIADVVEKPDPAAAPSDLALAGRYIFEPAVFDRIERIAPRPSGELFLPDAIRLMIDEGYTARAVCLIDDEKRYDIGNFQSYFQAFIDFALEDDEFGADVLEHLQRRLQRHEMGVLDRAGLVTRR